MKNILRRLYDAQITVIAPEDLELFCVGNVENYCHKPHKVCYRICS